MEDKRLGGSFWKGFLEEEEIPGTRLCEMDRAYKTKKGTAASLALTAGKEAVGNGSSKAACD